MPAKTAYEIDNRQIEVRTFPVPARADGISRAGDIVSIWFPYADPIQPSDITQIIAAQAAHKWGRITCRLLSGNNYEVTIETALPTITPIVDGVVGSELIVTNNVVIFEVDSAETFTVDTVEADNAEVTCG